MSNDLMKLDDRITKEKQQTRLVAEAEPIGARYSDLKVEYDIAHAAATRFAEEAAEHIFNRTARATTADAVYLYEDWAAEAEQDAKWWAAKADDLLDKMLAAAPNDRGSG
jgi:hypothetical protein